VGCLQNAIQKVCAGGAHSQPCHHPLGFEEGFMLLGALGAMAQVIANLQLIHS
jgi:hypothetical protein